MAIYIRRLYEDDQYARVHVGGRYLEDWSTGSSRDGKQSVAFKPLAINVREDFTLHERHHLRLREEIGFRREDFALPRVFGFQLSQSLLNTTAKGEDLFSTSSYFTPWILDPGTRRVTLSEGSQRLSEMAVVDIAKQHRSIESFKLGFDRGFNPSIILVESSAKARKTAYVDRAGTVPTDSENRAMQVRMKGFSDWKADDADGWNDLRSGAGGGVEVCRNKARPGLWALQGDRVRGLDVHLLDVPGAQGFTRGTHVVLKRVIADNCVVWDVAIDNMPSDGKWRPFSSR